MRTSLLAIAAGVIGCAPPLQQRVAPYPGYGQTLSQVQRDSAECDSWARSIAGSAGDSVGGGGAAGAVGGAAAGAALGAIAGAFLGDAGSGAAIGAALGGTSGALNGAAAGAEGYDVRLVTAYQNCMGARGYVINGGTIDPAARPSGRQPPVAATEDQGPSIETRLIRLRELYHDGLITDGEYRERRRAILDDL